MTDEIDSLVLEMLRQIRTDVADLKAGQRRIEVRMTGIEQQIAGINTQLAAQSDRLDSLDQRVDRIERRLDLADTTH